jgi:hypothetical protein
MPGQQYTDTAPKATGHIAEIIYQVSNLLSVGTIASPVRMHDDEHIDLPWTTGINGISGVPKDADVDFKDLTYTTISGDMVWDKYPFMLMDSAKLRSVDPLMRAKALKAAGEWHAYSMDNHILTNLVAGAGQTTAAGTVWSAATADIESNIKDIWNACSSNSNATLAEIKNCFLIVPMDVYAEVKSLQLINNIQVEYKDYFKTSLGLTILPSRDYGSGTALTNNALFLFGGDSTSITWRYSPAAASAKGVPLVETDRIAGKGDTYVSQQAHFTMIIEDSAGSGTTSRIGTITGVRA